MLRTMIVEHNVPFRELFRDILLSYSPSMDIIETGDGEEALRKLSPYPPDLIFMDIRLPGQNGLELTRKIKADYQNITIAIVTSYDLPEYRQAATLCGANCFIDKNSLKFGEIAAFVKCFENAKDSGRQKPSCVRLVSQDLP